MYKNLKQVKSDEYGQVVLAIDLRTKEKVIVKGKCKGLLGLESFCHGQLDHPNIPKLKDAYTDMVMDYLVIEYVEGVTLNQLIEANQPIACNVVNIWLRQALQALSYIHDNNIIHRDLTPKNMVIAKDMTLNIIDFGISVPFGYQDATVAGNLNYAPPEQILNPKAVSVQSDIYSLGKSFLDLVNRYPILYPKDLCLVLKKAMALNPEDRYDDCHAMIQALKAAYC